MFRRAVPGGRPCDSDRRPWTLRLGRVVKAAGFRTAVTMWASSMVASQSVMAVPRPPTHCRRRAPSHNAHVSSTALAGGWLGPLEPCPGFASRPRPRRQGGRRGGVRRGGPAGWPFHDRCRGRCSGPRACNLGPASWISTRTSATSGWLEAAGELGAESDPADHPRVQGGGCIRMLCRSWGCSRSQTMTGSEPLPLPGAGLGERPEPMLWVIVIGASESLWPFRAEAPYGEFGRRF